LAGCSGKPKPWREQRVVEPHFELVEWMRGTKERVVPVGADIDGDRAQFSNPQPGVVGWMRDLESAGGRDAAPPSREPHGFTVEITEARVYLRSGSKRRLIKKFKGDLRFWPSPDGTKLLLQKVSRDGRIRIIDSTGQVAPLLGRAVEGLDPTFNKYPFSFVRWDEDSQHITVLTAHRPEARGYVFVARWRMHTASGERTLVDERLLLLSDEVSDWLLKPIPSGATAGQVAPILRRLTGHDDAWVARAAREALARIRGEKAPAN